MFCTVADGVCTFSVTGNASTATALAADPADCGALGVATGIAASGALTCGYAINTDIQAYNATLAALAAQTESQGGIQYFTADNTPAILAKGTAYQHLRMNAAADAPEWAAPDNIPIAAAAGTVDAITADYTPDVALTDKTVVMFRAAGANTTTTPSFAPDGLAAHTIVKSGGSALVAGDIPAANALCIVQYDSANTRWELLNPVVPVNSMLTALSALAGGGANTLLGYNGDSTLGWYGTHSHSDSAAQFYSATANKGTLLFDQTGITDDKLVTVKYISTDNYTYTPTLLGNVTHSLGTTWTDGKWCTYSTVSGLTCNEDAPVGSGDVTGVGDCTGGACYDGSSDGGTYTRLYDGTSSYNSITAGVRTLTFASALADAENLILTFGNNDNSLALSSSTGVTTFNLDYAITQFRVDAAAYLTITVADGGGATIGQTSDGNDSITIGDGGDDIRIVMNKNAADGTWSGLTINLTAHQNLAFGDLVYVYSDGEAALADADAEATMPCIGIVVVAANEDATATILIDGTITETDWNWTPGARLYVSETAGGIESTVGNISDTNDVVQVIGVALTADTILFRPSLTEVVIN